MDVVLWSRRFDGLDRPMSDEEAQCARHSRRRCGRSRSTWRRRRLTSRPAPTSSASTSRLRPASKGLVGRDVLDALPDRRDAHQHGAGEIVDQAALQLAVKKKFLRVGLDVFANEPAAGNWRLQRSDLVAMPDVYGTHHIGASTDQAQEAIAAETVRIVRNFKETGKVPNVVNLARRTPATHILVVRHRDRPGVLAHVFDHLRKSNLNVQETENIVFAGAEAAVARINLDGAPAPALCDKIKGGNPDVLDLQVVKL